MRAFDAEAEEGERTEVADVLDRRVRICADLCGTCIFRQGNLMHLGHGRLRGMIRATAADHGHIPCHKTLNGNPDGLPGAVCQGWLRHPVARSSFVAVAIRLFRRVALLDTASGQLTHHDDYRLEGPMGTWGMGPLDSDAALDFRFNVAAQPTPDAREELLSIHLEALSGYPTDHSRLLTGQGRLDLDQALQLGVAACALVVEKLAGEYLFGYPPDPEDADGIPQFRLEMLPEVSVYLHDAALRAALTARALFGHPDLPVWGTDDDAIVYRATLDSLTERLLPDASGHRTNPKGTTP